MQLTSTDETELLMPLYAGAHDKSSWNIFLSRLQKRTGADYAALIFGPGNIPMHHANEVFTGRNLRKEAEEAGLDYLYRLDRMPYDRLRPDRVYSPAEFVAHDHQFRAFYTDFNSQLRVSDERIVRIREQEGANAWLSLARSEQYFSSADGALLGAIAPHVGVALRNFVLSERHRIRSMASEEGLTRSGAGWIVMDRDARILDIEPLVAKLLMHAAGMPRLTGERLHSDHASGRRLILHAANAFWHNPDSSSCVVNLTEEPRIDALLVPVTERPAAALHQPAMMAFCRVARDTSQQRTKFYAALFDLPIREAELAVALGDGRSLVEAAEQLHLTEATARNYSKRIFSKLGVRGQTELVRHVLLSSAWLA